MSTPRPAEVLRNYFATEMDRNVDTIMEFFADNARFSGPNEVRSGHGEIRPFYEDSCTRFPVLDVKVVTSFDHGDNAVAEWDAILTDPDGVELTLKGANVARIIEGKIVDMRSYYDAGRYEAK
jgi:ketosteroid isomerase-like protein